MGIPGERGQVGPRVSLTKLCFYNLLKIDDINYVSFVHSLNCVITF